LRNHRSAYCTYDLDCDELPERLFSAQPFGLDPHQLASHVLAYLVDEVSSGSSEENGVQSFEYTGVIVAWTMKEEDLKEEVS
jgi:hypothetical protein